MRCSLDQTRIFRPVWRCCVDGWALLWRSIWFGCGDSGGHPSARRLCTSGMVLRAFRSGMFVVGRVQSRAFGVVPRVTCGYL